MNIPKHWTTLPLRELVIAQKGRKPLRLSHEKFIDSVPYLDIEAVEKRNINQYADPLSTILATEKDIFVVADGYRSGLVAKGMAGAVGSTIICLTPLVINQLYLFYFLKSQFAFLNGNTTGANVRHLNQELFYNMEVPVPPLQEQEAIVAELEGKLKIYEQDFQNVENELLKLSSYKKSVLEEAITGNLTKDWRAVNLNNANEISNSANITRGIERFFSERILVEWKFEKLGSIIESITSGKSFLCEERPPEGDEVGVLKVSAVSSGSYLENESKTCTDQSKINPDIYVQEGDFLISRANTTTLVGACVVVENVSKNIMLSDKILRIKFKKGNPKFVLYTLKSRIGRQQIEAYASGSQESMKNISQRSIKNIVIPFPALAEQDEIVDRLENLLNNIDLIEEECNKRFQSIEMLQQSLLSLAFSGFLVKPILVSNSANDWLEKISTLKEKKQKDLKEMKNKQTELRSKAFMSAKDPNVVKEYIKSFTLDNYNSLDLLSDEDIAVIRDHTQSNFKDFDYDDFAALFLEMVQDKVNVTDEGPFFTAINLNGKLAFKVKK